MEPSVLIVDDEKNIRLTMSQSLEAIGVRILTAVNGEDALQKLNQEQIDLVFLDLKMPGIDGMQVLHRIKEHWPKIRVIIITAHGTVESAVEAMKLGAIDFIQKPFSPTEIRQTAHQVLEREKLDSDTAVDYPTLIELAKLYVSDRDFALARETTQKAITADPAQPEAYNILGALFELKGERSEAQKFYRAALDMDPSFKAAWTNLERTTSWFKTSKIDFGQDKAEPQKAKAGEEPDE